MWLNISSLSPQGSPTGIVAKVLPCDLLVSEFELQSYYCVHFQINNLGEMYEPSYPPITGWILPQLLFLKDVFEIE